jgi:hypothetical protein
VHPRRACASQRRDRALVERHVLADERAVEVGGDDPEVAREVFGEPERQPFWLPPLAFTT